MKRNLFFLILFSLSLSCAVAQDDHNFEVSKNLEIFNSLYKTLDLYYVDTLKADRQIGDAIGYMLDGLDPYTEYYPEQDTKDLETLTTGKYAGIGAIISYDKKYDRCVIREPYENMPAAVAGLIPGDVILSIDGKDTGVKGSKQTEDYTASVSKSLRGDPNTEINIVVDRIGRGNLTFKFRRAAIQLPAVSYAGMLTDSVGYIYLRTYTQNCSDEVLRTMNTLKQKGAHSLILDIRDNGGGLALEAVNIVNLFIPKGKLILQMKGKTKDSNSSYFTRNEVADAKIPVVVLVNGGSASSSEITCGALQDLDRAVVLGERTFGKGLVQQPRQLPYGGLLKLTTSHYYIPSGRCIQALDYSHRGKNGEVYRTPDSLTHVFHTAAGRPVRDGGGITPDVEVKSDSLPNLIVYLQNSTQLIDYIAQFRSQHPTIAPADRFSVSDEDYEAFKKFLSESDFSYDQQTYKVLQELKKIARFEGYDRTASGEIAALESKLKHNLAEDLDAWKTEVKQLLNEEICHNYYYQRGAIMNKLGHDRQISAAVKLLRTPEAYYKILKAKK